jgi:hypothetical protein
MKWGSCGWKSSWRIGKRWGKLQMGQSVPQRRFEPGTFLIRIRKLTLEPVGSGHSLSDKTYRFLISNFRHVLNVVCFLLGNSPASEFYMPTFRNTLVTFIGN